MKITTTVPESPEWWLKRLGTKLSDRLDRYDMLERYYSGDHPLPEGDERVREFFRRFQRKARTNYCGLIADATHERIRYEGFKVGTGSSDEAEGNALARHIWQANKMDGQANLAHGTALQLSDAYLIVGPPRDGQDFPRISVEDPRQVIVECDPLDSDIVLAGLKTWVDSVAKTRHAIVYLPDGFHYFRASGTSRSFRSSTWEWDDDKRSAENKLKAVPVVRLMGRPFGLAGEGLAEFEDVIDIQDRVNDTVLNRMVITKMQAFRQRWVTGLKDEPDGEETKFFPGPDLVWAVDDKDVKFGDFEQADIAPLSAAIKDDVTAMVTLSGLPPQYTAGTIVNVSAEGLAATDARQVDKAEDRCVYFGESHEQAMRLAFAWLGKSDLIGEDAEVTWADPQRRSVAQLADAAVKYKAADVPWWERMKLLGYTENDRARLEDERADDIANGLLAPDPAVVTGMANTPSA